MSVGGSWNHRAEVSSPNGQVTVIFGLEGRGDWKGQPTYAITFRGRSVVEPSHLGLVLAGAAPLVSHFEIEDLWMKEGDTTWRPIYGERSEIVDRYREMTVVLRERIPPKRRLWIQFRAYDEGAVFRYIIPQRRSADDNEWIILREDSQFRFPQGCYAYEEHGTEGEYFRKPVSEIAPECQHPLTVEYPSGIVASLIEAAAFDYPRMLLAPHPKESRVLVTVLDGPVRAGPGFSTPWRGFIIGERPGDLLERNYLILNLAPPCALKETDWIKPGKAIRDMTLSTAGAKACVDFAVQHNLQYIAFDAGWYGPEFSDASDATSVSVDPRRRKSEFGNLDLHEVIRYAANRAVGVWLYVNRRALERQMDELFSLFRQWGVAGVKFGFVEVGDQAWTRWLHDAVRKAADHRLLVDIHDSYRPSGFSRTYPNLLTHHFAPLAGGVRWFFLRRRPSRRSLEARTWRPCVHPVIKAHEIQ